jgi:hypothetical protein
MVTQRPREGKDFLENLQLLAWPSYALRCSWFRSSIVGLLLEEETLWDMEEVFFLRFECTTALFYSLKINSLIWADFGPWAGKQTGAAVLTVASTIQEDFVASNCGNTPKRRPTKLWGTFMIRNFCIARSPNHHLAKLPGRLLGNPNSLGFFFWFCFQLSCVFRKEEQGGMQKAELW